MASAFQTSAFQVTAFQITTVGPQPSLPGETILQRHHVDRALWPSGYVVSRERWSRYKDRWRIEELQAKRELKRKERKEQEKLGYEKIDYDKYKFQVNTGESLYHNFLLGLERQQAEQAAQQASLFAKDQQLRMAALEAVNQRNLSNARKAAMLQFQRETAEEIEAMEILEMMDDDD